MDTYLRLFTLCLRNYIWNVCQCSTCTLWAHTTCPYQKARPFLQRHCPGKQCTFNSITMCILTLTLKSLSSKIFSNFKSLCTMLFCKNKPWKKDKSTTLHFEHYFLYRGCISNEIAIHECFFYKYVSSTRFVFFSFKPLCMFIKEPFLPLDWHAGALPTEMSSPNVSSLPILSISLLGVPVILSLTDP